MPQHVALKPDSRKLPHCPFLPAGACPPLIDHLSGDYTVGVLETVEARGAPDSDSPGEVGLRIPPPPPRVHVRASDGGTPAHVRVARRIAAGR